MSHVMGKEDILDGAMMRLLSVLVWLAGLLPAFAQDNDIARIKARADKGDASAQFILGLRYANGQGVAQDYAEAAKWYRKAADQGYASAQFLLGVMYDEGRGVAQNHVQAYVWMSLSAAGSNGDDHKRAAKARDNVAARLTPAQLEQGQRMAGEFKRK